MSTLDDKNNKGRDQENFGDLSKSQQKSLLLIEYFITHSFIFICVGIGNRDNYMTSSG